MKLKAVSASIVAACAALSLGTSVAMASTSAGVEALPPLVRKTSHNPLCKFCIVLISFDSQSSILAAFSWNL
ncbi:hypothetical protein GCM10025858_36310 [Alicyclobacillus sacchari]|nr:hypothetical protein GCM10025858_00350 [Alicyclobacillus sacchari]GMA59128.1 hypothetical protein GCM10025858_36310 [Alicyclobacillus sacchari]